MSDLKHAAPTESREAIEARAADFLQRRRILRWSEADQLELNAWLDESTLHRVAYLRLVGSEALIEKLSDMRPVDVSRALGISRYRFVVPLLAAVASFSLIAVLGVAAARYFRGPSDRVYSTEVGGRALLSFADHSQIELNTDTLVRFRMTGVERTVWLERGEAWFRVSHDASRPFTVLVGNHRVTDLGTEFLIRTDAGRTEVALLKGRAQLSTDGDRSQLATLTPGDEAIATPISTSFTKKTAQELADELAWQRGVLRFRSTKLADAVSEFNRYNRTKLVIDDPAVARMLIGGDFKTDSINEFLQTIEMVLNVRAGRDGNDILLYRAPAKAARDERNP